MRAKRDYLVTGMSGTGLGIWWHQWIVSAYTAAEAKRRISRSTRATAWDGERIRRLEVERCENIPDILLENVERI